MRTRNIVILLALLMALVGLYPSGATSDEPPYWQFSAKYFCGRVVTEGSEASGFTGQDSDIDPAVPGVYETAINVHNPNFSTVAGASNVAPNTRGPDPITQPTQSFFFSPTFRKKALILYPTNPAGRSEDPTPPENWVRPDNLPYDYGFEIDCKDIRERLITSSDPRHDDPFIKGYVVIEERSNLPIDVTVAITSIGLAERDVGGATAGPQQGTICESDDTGDCDLVGGFSQHVEDVEPKRIR
jgi:hypothetical protein